MARGARGERRRRGAARSRVGATGAGTAQGLARLAAVAALAAMAVVPMAAAGQSGTDWCPEPEAHRFDFWIGAWDVQNLNRPPNGDRWFATGRATDRVYAVVGGCAVVEHWRGYAWPAAGHIVGYSVRAWDPATRQWALMLLWPIQGPPSFGRSRGVFSGGRGSFRNTFVSPQGDTATSSLNFYDIGDDTFTWSNGVSRDGGESWESSWRMEFRRRPATADGLWNGPSMTTDRCPGPEHRTFDAYVGEWRGTRVDAAGDSVAVSTHLVRILEGCAVMELTRAEDGSWESYAVRAYEPGSGRWVEYAVASDRRTLHRREAVDVPDGITFTDAEPVAGTYLRTRWLMDGDGIRRVEERATGPDGRWRAVAESRFPSRVTVGPAGG